MMKGAAWKRWILLLVTVGALVLVGLWKEGKRAASVDPQVPVVHRSATVVEAKVAQKEQKLEGGQPQHPDARAEWRYRQRAGDQGGLSAERLMQAKVDLDALRRAQQQVTPTPKDGGLNEWEWLGPGNIGGRIRALAIHPTSPSTMWIGGASGGIWKTTNDGASWQPLNDFLPSLAVTSIVVDPSLPDVLFAATGETFAGNGLPGAGIFKSINGGLTWEQLPSTAGPAFQWVNRLAHHPTMPNVLFAATSDPGGGGRPDPGGAVYRSTDGGLTWENVLSQGLGQALDVKVHPNNGNLVLVGTRNEVWFSTSGGSAGTWVEMTGAGAGDLPMNTQRCEVAFAPSNQNVLYVSMNRNSGEVWRSTDQGGTWTLQNTGSNYLSSQGNYDNAIWVDPTNANHVIVGGIDLWQSFDGGQTLTQISDWHGYYDPNNFSAHADHHVIAHPPGYDGVNNTTVFFGNDGGLQKTDDVLNVSLFDGWQNLANNLGITQFYGGAAAPDGSVIVGGSQDNSHIRYRATDGAQGWYVAFTGDGGYAAVDFTDPSIIYGEWQFLNFVKSTDGGQTYSDAVNGLGDAGDNSLAPFIAPFSMDPNDPSILVAGASSIWRTTDSAANWSSIRAARAADASAVDIATGNSDIIWVGYQDGRVSVTTDAGGTWTNVDGNTNSDGEALPNRWITDLAIDPFDANRVIVTLGGYFSNSVWMTENGGQSWQERAGTAPSDLPAVQVNTVRFHPANSNWVYIGTDLGIFASEDRGLTWGITPLYPGVDHEGPVNTEVDELFWQSDHLIAATYGRGMYRTRPLVVVYVDANAPPGGDGTPAQPYDNLHDALAAAGAGSTIHILGGTYPDAPVTFIKRVHITTAGGNVLVR